VVKRFGPTKEPHKLRSDIEAALAEGAAPEAAAG
jgi:hypothetical protein